MNNIITIDFETRSEADLKKIGPWAYAEHPSTEILCMAYKIGETAPYIWMPDNIFTKLDLKHIQEANLNYEPDPCIEWMSHDGIIFEAHNAEFERAIWHHICHKRYDWPDIPIEKWQCSAAKAAALSLPRSLEKVGDVLNLPVKKSKEGHKLMLKMCKPRKPRKKERETWMIENAFAEKPLTKAEHEYAEKNMPTLWHETPEDIINNCLYCKQDVEAEHCLSQHLYNLSDYERKIWHIDQRINTRGVRIDVETVQAVFDLVEQHERESNLQLYKLTSGYVQTAKQVAKLCEWLNGSAGMQVSDLQAATVSNLLETIKSPSVREILRIRQSLSKSSVSKYKSMLAGLSSDNRARSLLMYHGALTGRWAGKRIQPQNLPRSTIKNIELAIDLIRSRNLPMLKTLFGDPMETFSALVRSMIVAEEGYRFLCGDFSSIEARVVAWLAGEEKTLDAFRNNLDLYKVAASTIYNVSYDDVTKDQRAVGKVAVLALGYGGGKGAFITMSKGYGVEVPDSKVQGIVKRWREGNPNIRAYWYNIEDAAKNAVRYPGQVFHVGLISWMKQGLFLYCRLPSGRFLSYYMPEVILHPSPWGKGETDTLIFQGVDTYTKQWSIIKTWGGKLVENIVQAVSRDLLCESMINHEAAGYDNVLLVHDEELAEVPNGQGSLDEFLEIMRIVPFWAEGLPMDADGWEGQRYRKG